MDSSKYSFKIISLLTISSIALYIVALVGESHLKESLGLKQYAIYLTEVKAILLAIFTGLLISCVTTLVTYFRAKEEFFSKLFNDLKTLYVDLRRISTFIKNITLTENVKSIQDLEHILSICIGLLNNYLTSSNQLNIYTYQPFTENTKEFNNITFLQNTFRDLQANFTSSKIELDIKLNEIKIQKNYHDTHNMSYPCNSCQQNKNGCPMPNDKCQKLSEHFSKKNELDKIALEILLEINQILTSIDTRISTLNPGIFSTLSKLDSARENKYNWVNFTQFMEPHIANVVDLIERKDRWKEIK